MSKPVRSWFCVRAIFMTVVFAALATGCSDDGGSGDNDGGGGGGDTGADGSSAGSVSFSVPSSVDGQTPVNQLTQTDIQAICDTIDQAMEPHQDELDGAVSREGACTYTGLIIGGAGLTSQSTETQRQEGVGQCEQMAGTCMQIPDTGDDEPAACGSTVPEDFGDCDVAVGTYVDCVEDIYNQTLADISVTRAFYDGLSCDLLLDASATYDRPDPIADPPETAACQAVEAACPGAIGG